MYIYIHICRYEFVKKSENLGEKGRIGLLYMDFLKSLPQRVYINLVCDLSVLLDSSCMS